MLTEVAEGVYVHRSEILQNNTIAIRGDAGVLIVDAGITSTEMSCLANDLANEDLPVVAGFATHPDWDHVLWHPALGDVPRYGTADCAGFMRDLRLDPGWPDHVAGGLPPEVADDVPLDRFGLLTGLPSGATSVPWDGPLVRLLEHRAHAPGHAALLLEDCGVLVAGDMLSDLFVPMLDDDRPTNDPIEDYLAALDVFDGVVDRIAVVLPGHGSVGLAGQARHRLDLDRAYIEALRDGRTAGDPRITAPKPGWEWVTAIHEGQQQRFASESDSTTS